MYGKSYEISHSRLIEYRFDKIEYRFINEFNNEKPILSLDNIFYNKKIYYTYNEYQEHLNLTRNYEKKEKNYKLNYINEKTFKNITITILKSNYVIISKSYNPTIHFIIEHPKLIEAIENFNPIVKE